MFSIYYKPTKEYIAFYSPTKKKDILFSDDKPEVYDALFDILTTDGGYDGPIDDFEIKSVDDITNDGSQYLTDDSTFVSSAVIK